jgi:thymidylate synthase (FAD)
LLHGLGDSSIERCILEMSERESEIGRPYVAAMDRIVGKRINVLDDGFVRVVDYMGGDSSIVQAARVSYGAGTSKVREDRGLIRYLMRHHHTTPFEMCELKLHVRVPMDAWRQWIRHRTANVNEYSTRYSVAIDKFQATDELRWRLQSKSNKQGSGGVLDAASGQHLSAREAEFHRLARDIYQERLTAGVAREQARKDLPLSTYTEAYWKIDLHNLFHFLRLRMDDHAQLEIREYATAIANEIVAEWCPVAWEAFCDYERAAVSLSGLEAKVAKLLASGSVDEAIVALTEAGLLERSDNGLWRRSREREELEAKLRGLGLAIPWAAV